jgi:hypothetical protein
MWVSDQALGVPTFSPIVGRDRSSSSHGVLLSSLCLMVSAVIRPRSRLEVPYLVHLSGFARGSSFSEQTPFGTV